MSSGGSWLKFGNSIPN